MITLPERFARAMVAQNQDACARLDRLYAIRDQIEADGEWPAWCAMPMSEVMSCLIAQYHADGPSFFYCRADRAPYGGLSLAKNEASVSL